MSPWSILLLWSVAMITVTSEQQYPHRITKRAFDWLPWPTIAETPTVCYGVIGCVEITPEFYHPLHRPFNSLPLPREIVNTQFILHTRDDSEGRLLSADAIDTIAQSSFEPSRETKFIIHGFLVDGNADWIQDLTASLLAYGDYNVIVTNWRGGSLPPYAQATANTRLVGLEIAHLIRILMAHFNVNPAQIHLIGHSLGAHTAGYAGERIPGIGRITGLDPAGPNFEWMPARVRLDPTDAQFVEAIHTDASSSVLFQGLGMIQPVAHVDYYINGGYSQPNCFPIHICRHHRSIYLFTSTLNGTCQYVAYECPDYATYLKGECTSCGEDNSHCARIGMDGDTYPLRNQVNVKMYISTGDSPINCKYHYHVKLNLAPTQDAQASVDGILRISLHGDKNTLRDVYLTASGNEKFVHGESKDFLVTAPVDVGTIQLIKLYWKPSFETSYTCDPAFCSNKLLVSGVQVSELDYYPEANRLQHTWDFCSPTGNYGALGDGISAEFHATACFGEFDMSKQNAALLKQSLNAIKPRDISFPESEYETFSLIPDYACYGELGCLNITKEFQAQHWPLLSVLPVDRDQVNTRFTLYTREDFTGQTIIASVGDSIASSTFNPQRGTKFIIHGYLCHGNYPWLIDLAKLLLRYGDYNVIITDWGRGAFPPYFQATANTRLVGLEIAHLVNTLIKNFGVNPGDVHLIGHSLGAHTAGYAGEKIRGLGRITGLDPAGPYFRDTDPIVRLDPTDALFVEAIHTDAKPFFFGYGMMQPVAHVDYYPNGGKNQPGCTSIPLFAKTNEDLAVLTVEESKSLVDDISQELEYFYCDHQRSVKFFMDSFTSSCQYTAYECEDYDTYLKGECASCGADNTHCAKMGIEGDKYPVRNRVNVKMYLTTGEVLPYCNAHYQIILSLAKSLGDQKSITGRLTLSVYGTKNEIQEAPLSLNGMVDLYPGFYKTFLFVLPFDFGTIDEVVLHWYPRTILFLPWGSPAPQLRVSSIQLSKLDYYPESERLLHTWKFCPVSGYDVTLVGEDVAQFVGKTCLKGRDGLSDSGISTNEISSESQTLEK